MAGSQQQHVTFTRLSMDEVVNKLDPKRLSTPQAVYQFSNGKLKYELPDLPGKDYRWAKGILPDE